MYLYFISMSLPSFLQISQHDRSSYWGGLVSGAIRNLKRVWRLHTVNNCVNLVSSSYKIYLPFNSCFYVTVISV